MNTVFQTPVKKLQSFNEAPIWARLDFAEMIPATYWWEGNTNDRRTISEVTVLGFERGDGSDVVWIHFTMDWIAEGEYVTLHYIWPAIKANSSERV